MKGKGPPKKKAPVSTTTSTTLSSCLSPERKTVSKASGNKVTFASPDRGIKTQQVRSPLLPTKAATGATVPAKSPTHPMGHSKPMTKKAFSIALGGNNWAEKQAANFKDWMNYTFQKAAQDSLSVCTHEAGDNPHIDDTRGKDTSELAAKNRYSNLYTILPADIRILFSEFLRKSKTFQMHTTHLILFMLKKRYV